jgi:hypothetical protein
MTSLFPVLFAFLKQASSGISSLPLSENSHGLSPCSFLNLLLCHYLIHCQYLSMEKASFYILEENAYSLILSSPCFWTVLRFELRASHLLGRCSALEPHLSPFFTLFTFQVRSVFAWDWSELQSSYLCLPLQLG